MKIALLAGDGIGPEILREAVRVLDVLRGEGVSIETESALVGGAAYDDSGEPLPKSTLDLVRKSDAVLFGAVGGTKYDTLPRDKRPEKAILGLRRLVAGGLERVGDGFRFAQAYAEMAGSEAAAGERGNQRLGKQGECAAPERVLEAVHQQLAVFRGRRRVEQTRAGKQIGVRAGGGEAAHDPRKEVLFHQDGIPRERGEDGIAVLRALRFEHPPAKQRNAWISSINIAADQLSNQREALIRG